MSGNSIRDSSLTSILQGAGFFAIGKIATVVLGFLLTYILTNGLGAALYGVYAFSWTIIQVVSSVSNLGADQAVLRFVPDEEKSSQKQLAISYVISIVGGFVLGLALFLSAPLISNISIDEPHFILVLRLFSILLIFNGIIIVTANAFRAIDRPDFNSLLKQVLKPASLTFAVGISYYFALEFIGYIIAVVIAVGSTAVIGVILFYKYANLRPELNSSGINLRSYLRYSIPLAFKDAGSVFYRRADILIVGGLLTSSAVGYYRVAIMLTTVLTIPLGAVNQIFPSRASALHSGDKKEELEQVFKTTTRWVITGTLPGAIGLIVFRYEILQIFGDEFSTASMVLILFTIAQLTSAFVGPSGYLLMMTDHQFTVATNQWITGGLNIVLNVFLILEFGFIGAAAATASVLALINIARLIQVYYFEQMHPISRKLVKPTIAAILSLVAMMSIHIFLSGIAALTIGVVIGLLVYVFCLVLFGLEPEDKILMNKIAPVL